MRFCELCKKSEDKAGPFKSIVMDFILLTEHSCCEECREVYENKPSTPYSFYNEEDKDDLGGFRPNGISKDRNILPTTV